MPRPARASRGGFCYHVLNRGNGRRTLFHKDGDYAAFVRLLAQAGERCGTRLLAWCLRPNHFHLVLWPRADGELNDYLPGAVPGLRDPGGACGRWGDRGSGWKEKCARSKGYCFRGRSRHNVRCPLFFFRHDTAIL
jgi:hypothetical protein